MNQQMFDLIYKALCQEFEMIRLLNARIAQLEMQLAEQRAVYPVTRAK